MVVHWGAAVAALWLATDSAAAIVRAASQFRAPEVAAELDLPQDSGAVSDSAAQRERMMDWMQAKEEGAQLEAELVLDWAQELASDWQKARPSAPARFGARTAVASVTAAVVLREVAVRAKALKVLRAQALNVEPALATLERAQDLAVLVARESRGQAAAYWATAMVEL